MIAVDFETYYSRTHTVQTMGPWGYAHHPDTDIYMVSVVGEGVEFVGCPTAFDWSLLAGKHLVSHNAGFDMVICLAGQARDLIPQFDYASWSCSADLMAYCGYPRALAKACKISFGVELPKVMRNWMSGKRWADAQAKGKDKELLEYALNDSIWCLKLWEKHSPAWPASERWLSAHTRQLIWRGVTVQKPALKRGIKQLQDLRDTAEGLVPWRSTGKILSLPALRDYCRALGIPAPKSLAKDSPEAAEWETKYGDKLAWVAALRDYRRTNMLLAKLNNMSVRVRHDGTMPVYLKYWGGHTGRWSGDAGVNVQNLPRGEMFGVNLREMVRPKPKHKFIISDLAQIEPRVLAWLGGDATFLDQLRTGGGSLYEAYARANGLWDKDATLKSGDPALYQLIKIQILGLGFGCGWAKFQALAHQWAGIVFTDEEAKNTVANWRGLNTTTTRFWKTLDGRLEHAKNQQQDLLEFELPSGRSVKWWQPRADREDTNDTVVNQTNGTFKCFTWGGKLTENVVQALSRDVFAHHIRQAEDAGIPVTFTVHDEIVAEVPNDQAKDALDTLTQIMSTPPEWIADLPLAADGGIHKHYTK